MGYIQVFDSQEHQLGTTKRAAIRQRKHKPITDRRLGGDPQKVTPLLIRREAEQRQPFLNVRIAVKHLLIRGSRGHARSPQNVDSDPGFALGVQGQHISGAAGDALAAAVLQAE